MKKYRFFYLGFILLLLSCGKSVTDELDPLAQQRAALLEDYGLVKITLNGGEEIEMFGIAGMYDSISTNAQGQVLYIICYSWNHYWLLGLKDDARLDAMSMVLWNLNGAGQYNLTEGNEENVNLTYWIGYYDQNEMEFLDDKTYNSDNEGFIKIEHITNDRVKGSFSTKLYQDGIAEPINASGTFDLPVNQ